MTESAKIKMLRMIQTLTLAELCAFSATVRRIAKERYEAEEKRQLRRFRVGDEVAFYERKGLRLVRIRITKIVRTKLLGKDLSAPGNRWKVSPIICEKVGRGQCGSASTKC